MLLEVVTHSLDQYLIGYGDSSYHHEVRAADVQYLRDNPEWFIESIVDTPWLWYISYVSLEEAAGQLHYYTSCSWCTKLKDRHRVKWYHKWSTIHIPGYIGHTCNLLRLDIFRIFWEEFKSIDIGDLYIDSCKSTESIQKRKCNRVPKEKIVAKWHWQWKCLQCYWWMSNKQNQKEERAAESYM